MNGSIMHRVPSQNFRPFAQSERGFTLTELALVVGIIGLIVSAIWIAAANVSESNKAQTVLKQTMQIVTGYRSLYSQAGIDTGLSGTTPNWQSVTTVGINANYFPNEMMLNGAPMSPWGGTVLVYTSQYDNTILVSYQSLPQSACVAVGSILSFLPDVIYENFNGTTNPLNLSPTSIYKPVSISTMTAYCAGNNNQVQIGFKAR